MADIIYENNIASVLTSDLTPTSTYATLDLNSSKASNLIPTITAPALGGVVPTTTFATAAITTVAGSTPLYSSVGSSLQNVSLHSKAGSVLAVSINATPLVGVITSMGLETPKSQPFGSFNPTPNITEQYYTSTDGSSFFIYSYITDYNNSPSVTTAKRSSSIDGLVWTTPTPLTGSEIPNLGYIMWSGAEWLCPSRVNTSLLLSSIDGITWASKSDTLIPINKPLVKAGAVYISASSATSVTHSTDLLNWVTTPIAPSIGTIIGSVNGVFLTSSGNTSVDGVTWTAAGTVGATNGGSLYIVQDTIFSRGVGGTFQTSTDTGVTWSAIHPLYGTNPVEGYDGTSLVVTTGTSYPYSYYYSTDMGTTYNPMPLNKTTLGSFYADHPYPPNTDMGVMAVLESSRAGFISYLGYAQRLGVNPIIDAVFDSNNNRFVALSSTGEIYATNPSDWGWSDLTQTGLPSTGVRSITFSEASGLIVLGDAGGVWASDTGTSWVANTNTLVDNLVVGLAFRGLLFAADATTKQFLSVDMGKTWSSITLPFSMQTVGIINIDNVVYMYGGIAGYVYATLDGVTWTTIHSSVDGVVGVGLRDATSITVYTAQTTTNYYPKLSDKAYRLTFSTNAEDTYEIIDVSYLRGDYMSLTSRGLEGTTPQSWAAGDNVSLRITADTANRSLQNTNTTLGASIHVGASLNGQVPSSIGSSDTRPKLSGNVVIGDYAYIDVESSVVLGALADTLQHSGSNDDAQICIGFKAKSEFSGNIVIGYKAHAYGYKESGTYNGSMAIGWGAYAGSFNAIAIGASSESGTPSQGGSVALGYKAKAISNCVALGDKSVADNGAVSVGSGVQAGRSSIVIGHNNKALGTNSINIGGGVLTGDSEIDIGGVFKKIGGTVSIGGLEVSAQSAGLSLGGATLDQTTTEQIAIGVGAATAGLYNIAIGSNATTSGLKSRAVALGYNSLAIGYSATALGGYTDAVDNYSVAVGHSAGAYANASISIGKHSESYGSYSMALGKYASVYGYAGIAVGYNTSSRAKADIAIGYQASTDSGLASSESRLAIGYEAYSYGHKSIAIGYNAHAYADATDSIAIGSYANSYGARCVSLGAYSGSISRGTYMISLGASAQASRSNTFVTSSVPTLRLDNTTTTGNSLQDFVGSEAVLASKSIDFTTPTSVSVSVPTGTSLVPTNVTVVSDLDSNAATIVQPTISISKSMPPKNYSNIVNAMGAELFDGTLYYRTSSVYVWGYPTGTLTFSFESSPDRVTWTPIGAPLLTTPRFSNDKLILQVVGTTIIVSSVLGGVWVSNDGLVTLINRVTAQPTGVINSQGVVVMGSIWIRPNTQAGTTVITRSIDGGLTWSDVPRTGLVLNPSSKVVADATKFYTVGSAYTTVASSTDGVAWTLHSTLPASVDDITLLGGLAMVGYTHDSDTLDPNIHITTDGVTWTTQAVKTLYPYISLYGGGGNTIIMVHGNTRSTNSLTEVKVSHDLGVTWSIEPIADGGTRDVLNILGSKFIRGQHVVNDYKLLGISPSSTEYIAATPALSLGVSGYQVYAAPPTQVRTITLNITVGGSASDVNANPIPYTGRLVIKGIVLESR